QLPASLSPTMIGILRDDLGFEGVIMTDAMEMGGIVTQYTIPQAAVMAIQAGVDVVTMGPNAALIEQENALEAVYQAVLSGELSETQLDEAVRRVLRVKARYGVLDWVALEPSEAPLRMQVEATRQTLISTFEAAISVVDSTHDFLPLGVDESVAIIYP